MGPSGISKILKILGDHGDSPNAETLEYNKKRNVWPLRGEKEKRDKNSDPYHGRLVRKCCKYEEMGCNRPSNDKHHHTEKT